MENEKIIDIVKNAKDKSNKDLIECRDVLHEEFIKTQDLIIKLTRHLDSIQYNYDMVNNEIGKRIK